MKKLWLKMIDSFRFKHIMNAAKTCGCDVDGDIVVYKGTTKYFVNIELNYICRL